MVLPNICKNILVNCLWLIIPFLLNVNQLAAQPLNHRPTQDGTFFCKGANHNHQLGTQHGNLMPQTQWSSSYVGYKILKASLNLNIDPAIRRVQGFVEYSVLPTTTLDSLFLDLDDALQIDSLFFEGEVVGYQKDNKLLKLILRRPQQIGDTGKFRIHYNGVPAQTQVLQAFGQRNHGSGFVISTVSQPYNSRVWWPCRQGLFDKIQALDINLTVPAGYTGVGQGKLVATENLPSGMRRFRWEHRHPVATYLVAIAVSNYEVFRDTLNLVNGPMVVENYHYPQSRTVWQREYPWLRGQFSLFEELFGPYPFANEQYGHVQGVLPGGMEHQTMSVMSTLEFSLMAHELAHQWFGDYVTCNSFRHLWLNEGWASYSEGLNNDFVYRFNWTSWKRERLDIILPNDTSSVYSPDTSNFLRLFSYQYTYIKGAMVLHQLRQFVGDDNFFRASRLYLQRFQNGFVNTEDFQAVMEEVSGLDLAPFFAAWVYGKGHPIVSGTWNTGANNELLLYLTQRGNVNPNQLFPMVLKVRAYDDLNDTLLTCRVENFSGLHSFRLNFTPREVILNPEWDAICEADVVASQQLKVAHNQALSLWPNPASEGIYLENQSSNPIDYTIRNSIGQVVANGKLETSQTYLPLNLPKGFYQIHSSNGQVAPLVIK